MVTNLIIETVIFLLVIIVFVLAFAFLELSLAIILFLLMGIWVLDMSMKRALNFENTTLFADLSFSALVFCIGQGVSLIDIKESKILIDPTYAMRFGFIIFILLFIWIMNLKICDYINQLNPKKSPNESSFWYVVAWAVSVIMGISSGIFVFVLQFI